MNSRLSTLQRIEVLYGLIESTHKTALQQATVRVHQAELVIAGEHSQAQTAAEQARQALSEGDRQQWMLAEVQSEFVRERRQQLETLRTELVRVANRAREEYDASRRNTGQMQSVVQRRRAEEQQVADRLTQAATDDRFLSRLRWIAQHPDMSLS